MKYEELIALLKTAETVDEINEHREEIAKMIPQVRIMFANNQKNYAHQDDLWMHCLHTVVALERNLWDDMLYLAAMLHDIGKPDCEVTGIKADDINMHYYRHAERSAQIVQEEIISTLLAYGARLSAEEQARLIYFVKYHDMWVNVRMKHLLTEQNTEDLEDYKNLLLLQAAVFRALLMIPVVEKREEIREKSFDKYADFSERETGYKQIIIARKDLNMSPGKLAAQVSHASMAFLAMMIRKNAEKRLNDEGTSLCYVSHVEMEQNLYEQWMEGAFTKCVLQAKNKNQLMKAVALAKVLGMKEGEDFFLIKDNCYTELEPEEIGSDGIGRTLTCIGFKPMEPAVIDRIGKKYHLWI